MKSPYPSTQDPGYAAALQQQAKEVLASADDPAFELADRQWVTEAVGQDPAEMTSLTRHGLDRLLDLHHWFDIHRPELRV